MVCPRRRDLRWTGDGMPEFRKALNKAVRFYKRYEYLFFAAAFLALAVVLRMCWLDFRSGDYNSFLSRWFDEIKEAGGLKGFASTVGDYTPMYKYIITFLTYLPMNSLYSYKMASCIFDVVLAVFAGLTVRHILGGNNLAGLMAYAVVLFLPVVFLNSAVWAQCDSIYTGFCLMSFYFLLKGKGRVSMTLYAIAFSFKLQAIFYAPAVVVFFLKGRLKFTDLLFFPLTYVLCALPATFAGMNFADALFGAYSVQIEEYPRLTLNAPNLYQMLSDSYNENEQLGDMMLVFSVGVCAVFCTYFYKARYRQDDRTALLTAYLFSVLMPFILPHMHERYFYMADIFAVVFTFVYPRKAYISGVTAYCSMRAVVKFLFDGGATKVSLIQVAFLMGAAIVALCIFVFRELNARKTGPESAAEELSSPEQVKRRLAESSGTLQDSIVTGEVHDKD